MKKSSLWTILTAVSLLFLASVAAEPLAAGQPEAQAAPFVAAGESASALTALRTPRPRLRAFGKSGGLVVDTMEITGPWAALPAIYDDTIAAIEAVGGTLAVSSHQSHAYTDGACLYFTFAGRTEPEDREAYYRAAWDAGTGAVLDHGGALSHHHGVGLNRSRFVPRALGEAFGVLQSMKHALDPNGILNPGKFGLDDPFGSPEWP